MKKFFIQAILLLVVIGGAIAFFSQAKNSAQLNSFTQIEPSNVLKVGNSLVKVDIANTPEKRKLGLGGRESLASDSGMLFIFEKEGVYTFWMKGLKFPLDFIWIRGGKVVSIHKDVPAPLPDQKDSDLQYYSSREPVDRVLEVNGGFVDSRGIKEGDIVEIQALEQQDIPTSVPSVQ